MPKQISEKILLYKLLSKKEPEAYVALYDRYVKQIYRFVYFKVSSHEEAEDITSDVFLRAWQYIQEQHEIKSLRGLLYRMARNAVVDLYRAKAQKPEAILDEEMEIGDGGKWYGDLHEQIDGRIILQALKKLKSDYREILTLRYVEDLETDEIGEIMGKGSIAVRVTLHRALNKLKEILKEDQV